MEILRTQWIYILPLVIITIFMLTGYSPGFSAILGLATCIAVSFKLPSTRIDLALAVIMVVVILCTFVNKAAGSEMIVPNVAVVFGIGV